MFDEHITDNNNRGKSLNIRKETKLCEHANGSRLWKDSTDTDSREITEHAHKRNARI